MLHCEAEEFYKPERINFVIPSIKVSGFQWVKTFSLVLVSEDETQKCMAKSTCMFAVCEYNPYAFLCVCIPF